MYCSRKLSWMPSKKPLTSMRPALPSIRMRRVRTVLRLFRKTFWDEIRNSCLKIVMMDYPVARACDARGVMHHARIVRRKDEGRVPRLVQPVHGRHDGLRPVSYTHLT